MHVEEEMRRKIRFKWRNSRKHLHFACNHATRRRPILRRKPSNIGANPDRRDAGEIDLSVETTVRRHGF